MDLLAPGASGLPRMSGSISWHMRSHHCSSSSMVWDMRCMGAGYVTETPFRNESFFLHYCHCQTAQIHVCSFAPRACLTNNTAHPLIKPDHGAVSPDLPRHPAAAVWPVGFHAALRLPHLTGRGGGHGTHVHHGAA